MTLTTELFELIEIAQDAADQGDESAHEWLLSLPEEIYEEFICLLLD